MGSKETLKFVGLGLLLSILVGFLIYLTLPKTLEVNSYGSQEGVDDYSMTVYGVPEMEVGHYRLGDDKYFDYTVKGVLDLGNKDPSKYPLWYERVLYNKLMEIDPDGEKKLSLKDIEDILFRGMELVEEEEDEKVVEEEKLQEEKEDVEGEGEENPQQEEVEGEELEEKEETKNLSDEDEK